VCVCVCVCVGVGVYIFVEYVFVHSWIYLLKLSRTQDVGLTLSGS